MIDSQTQSTQLCVVKTYSAFTGKRAGIRPARSKPRHRSRRICRTAGARLVREKSTLLNVIGGLDGFDAGRDPAVGGTNLGALNAAEPIEMRLNKVGFVFQSYEFDSGFVCPENVEFILQLQGVPGQEQQERASIALQSLGLGDLGDRRPGKVVWWPATACRHCSSHCHRSSAVARR